MKRQFQRLYEALVIDRPTLTVALLLALLATAAIMNNDRKTMQVLRWCMLLIGIAIVGQLLMFALDSLQIQAQLNQNVKPNFYKVALRAALVGVMLATLYLWFGLAIGKVLKSQGVARGNVKDADSMLMVGTRDARPNLRAIDTAESRKEMKKEGTGGLSIDS